MRADAHQKRALQLEHALDILGDPATDPDIVPSVVENYWGAAFHLLFGAEAPAFRHGVSAVCSVWWYTAGVLRHSRFGESERFAPHLPNRTFRRCWQESLPA